MTTRPIILVALLLLAIQHSSTLSITVKEQSNVKALSTWNFRILLHLLERNFPNIDSTHGLAEMQFLNPELVVNYVAPEAEPVFLPQENAVRFEYPKTTFTFTMKFCWIYTLAIFPISGSLDTVISATDVLYTLQYKGASVIPKISAKWTIHNVTIHENLIAESLGIGPALKDAITKQWDEVAVAYINFKLVPGMKEYFRIKYPDEHNLIVSYFDSNHMLTYHYTLNRFQVNSDNVQYSYQGSLQSAAPYTRNSDPESYAVNYFFPTETFTTIVQNLFGILFPNFDLSNDDIAEDVTFRLNAQQLAQVVPDFLISEGNVNVTARIVNLPHQVSIERVSNSAVKIEGLQFCLTFMHEGVRIVTGNIELSGTFAPIVNIIPGQNSAMFHLRADALHAKVLSMEAFHYKSILKSGLERYVEYAFDDWIKKTYSTGVLGNGIYLEFDEELCPHKSYAEMTDEGIQVWLFLHK